ncbi:nitrite reductase large subunit NirB [Flammeovirga kamogawensis]|uniref:Nitrite reductase large subunit NirB n=1 Tax=Flammeovirga kamogawensis TaxID=373891 RepID=A0ABX8GUY9_9BACT|nr:nitrite reductase large subunit NirB [Flammeovirga kamogawensis]MBB6461679.1 nitrite reductase (NADH) large subunit [Flammeovirga kamogawensis]QWG07396.1 nitrite reductase large subunit NirB [Flammeovirga kamogawensis]TRX69209.1 nitrite reductase large subunit [Flammeovirga kamogawensis]
MTKIVIVGNGMVSYKLCEKLIEKNTSASITVIGEEPRPAYDRVHLSAYFEDENAEKLSMASRDWYKGNGINLITSEKVSLINREQQTITTHTNSTYSYDYLVLATGSSAFVPPIKGVDKKGVFVYRTIEDLELMMAYGKKAKSAAVLGGGLLGLEAAKAAIDMKLKTSVVEFAPRLMPRQIDEVGGDLLKSKMEGIGIDVLLGKATSEIVGDDVMTGLSFSDDTALNVDMLIISAGIRPRDELGKAADIKTAERGGFVVNSLMQTNDEKIFAIGECASYENMIYGLVAPGYDMAEVVAEQIANENKEYTFEGCDMSTKLKLIGVDVASFGDPFCENIPHFPITINDQQNGIYKRINISEDGSKLLGGILIGDAEDYNMLHQMFINEMALPPHPQDLIIKSTGDGGAAIGVDALPDTAQVCSCENVTKGDICCSIKDDGVTDINGIKKATKAGTGCGGCMPMVNNILEDTLQKMGTVIRKEICEHFTYTRQEMFDLIKVNEIKTYDELLAKYGQGGGCETCKPLVGSLLASIWNDLILKEATIQDTNDRFLANIQKGGSYSVVPRIAGGEITPDKLIVIGEVAKEFDLYTKITGGQRIDLFGAKLNDLPLIWERFIDAGFESGHAYGKSLRTVKSCVGSTWCRFGLHDSVGFAIEIENRYKGLRSPHKLKGGVSGCIRECAEARGKDFGVIATEKGWNLYVGGNGGANPKHAVLLAGDIDKETVIKYIDRYLMFYIKTAEPLQRTAPWLEKLEGGIEYLKQVVVEDSLGIGEQLESDMEVLKAHYSCEWKEAVKNPEIRKRFAHFSNTDQDDPTLKFKRERDQKFPVAW